MAMKVLLSLALASAVALGSCRAAAEAPAPPSEPDEPGPWHPRYLALPFHIGVTSYLDLPELNDRLEAAGIAGLATVQTMMGGGVTLVFESGLVVAPQHRFSIVNNGAEFGQPEASLLVHTPMLDIGYVVVERNELMLYPVIGVGFGVTQLSIHAPGAPQPFDDALRAPEEDDASLTTLESVGMALHVGIASAVWGSGHGDFIGARTGFIVSPFENGWKNVAATAFDGPHPPLSGGYLHLMFGWHTPASRRSIDVTPFD